MRILYIASNPEGARTIQVAEELNFLREKLDNVPTPDLIDLRVYSKIRPDDLAATIARNSADVIHFSGHANEEGIRLDDGEGGSLPLDGVSLSQMLNGLNSRPRLIVISACSSTKMAATLAGAANFVIGMNAPVTNEGARAFSANLYQRLASGASVGAAFAVANASLGVIDRQEVAAELYPVDSMDRAKHCLVGDPLRLLVRIPVIDKWLAENRTSPNKDLNPKYPHVQFGLAGVPDAARLAALFTDDTDIRPRQGQSFFDSRGWFIEAQPVNGRLWFAGKYYYYGDMRWYGCVTTGDHKIYSCTATTTEGLERHYYDEQLRGPLADQIRKALDKTIANLRANDGSLS